jgi:hypothetical protein
LPEGHVRISSDKKDGDCQATSNLDGWSTYITIATPNVRILNRIVAETGKAYWVYRMILTDNLNLAHIQSQMQERTGQEYAGGGTSYTDGVLTGQSIKYPFGNVKGAPLRIELSDSKDEGGTVELVIDSRSDEGFFQAHNVLTYDVILSLLLGVFTPSKRQQLINEACSKHVR